MGLDPASSDMTGVPVRSPVTPHHDESYYDWETSNVAHIFIEDVYTRMLEFPESTTSDILFSIFLVVTAWPRITDESSSPGSDQVQVLLAAAGRGSVQARGVLDTVSRYYGSTLGRDIDVKLPEWRRTAVLSGSLLARRELALHDREAYIECTKRFREEGGYAMLYASVDSNERINIRSSDQGYSRLHWLVTCGTPAALQTYLESERDIDIDRLTAREETAVYLACARGSLEMLQILLANGADCRMTCTQWRISCLHWAFAFDEDTQAQVISCIVAAGANLDTMTSGDTPFPHYPFILPRGTPLHWAVATGSHVMIEALILHRANVLARNGHDIYVYDRRVRALNEFGGANLDDMEAYSVPNGNVEGLTALDYAAMALDYFIFEDLIRLGLPCDVNDVDEEGLSVLHRLSTSPRRRTRTGNQFCDTVFRGARSERHEALVRSIKAITELGGNLELLTTRSSTIFDYTGIEATFPQYTPLMMAALGTSEELVDVLLSAGAEVNAVNDKGGTALLCVSEDVEAASKIIPILISHGAEINHADHHGSTAVAIAAGYCITDTVELLLSKGADIESKSSAEDAAFQGCSIFGMLASADKPFNDAEDQSLRRMLEDYVFASPDRAKRRRVVDQGDSNGHTLLHHYSRNGLPHCVKALLSNSAPVNAIERRYRTERDGSMDVRLTWYETPLDAAQITRDRKVKDMQRGSIHTLEQNEDILSKLNAVIDALQAAGGVCRRNFVQRETCEDV
jgi:ankyrin repeat protein